MQTRRYMHMCAYTCTYVYLKLQIYIFFIWTYLPVIKDTTVDGFAARRKHQCLQALEARQGNSWPEQWLLV